MRLERERSGWEQLNRRKLCFLSLAFLTGVAAAEYRQFLLWMLLILFVLIWTVSIGREYGKTKKGVFWILVFAAAVSLGAHASCSRQSVLRSYEALLKEDAKCLVQGKIYQKEQKEDDGLFCYYLKNCRVQFDHKEYSCNHILLNLKAEEYGIGEILCVKGKMKTFDLPVNEGNYDEQAYYRSLNIDFGVEGEETLLVKGRKNRLRERLFTLKKRIKESFQSVMPERDAGVLLAMVSGDKSLMDAKRKNMYQNAGISHFYSISGLHISMLGMAVYRLIKKRGGSYFAAGLIAGTWILAYGAMIDFGISASRAIGMFLLLLYAKYRGRSYDRATALALMAAALAGNNPGIVRHAGYLLSFGAVCGVILAEELFWHRQTDTEEEQKAGIVQNAKETFLVSLCIQLVTIPVMCRFFYEISIYAVCINMVILPCMGILLGFGIVGGIVGCIAPLAGKIILYPCYMILLFFDGVCKASAKLPYSSWITGSLSASGVLLWYGFLFLFLFVRKKVQKLPKIFLLLPFCILLFGQRQNPFEIDVLDVGQGDGIYISMGDGVSVFVDGGSSDVSKAGLYRILPFLKYRGIRRIDYWFVSHCDADHISGLCEIIEADYEIRHLAVSAYMPKDDAWKELKGLAEKKGIDIITMKKGDAVTQAGDGWKIQCLAPIQQSGEADRNKNSMVLLLQHADCIGFFGGDMGEAEERKLAGQKNLPKVDVYKASHHGSDTSNSREILDALEPEISVISCGLNNRYGHPGKGTLERLEEAGSRIYETRYLGQIKIMGRNLDVKGFSVLE